MSATIVAASGWRKRAAGLGQALAVTVMATALVTSLHLYARNPAPEPVPLAKSAERLVFETEEVALRLTGGFDGLASFGLPFVEPTAWSETPRLAEAAPAGAPAPVRPAQAERRVVAALPPSRPATVAVPHAAPSLDAATRIETVAQAAPADRRMRVFGLGLPGTEYLPTPREAVGHVASLGAVIASAGEAVGDAVLPH